VKIKKNVGIDLSPLQVVPNYSYIQIFSVCDTERIEVSSVDLTRSVYKTPHVTFRFQGFNPITSLDTLIVIVELQLASLLWERVYRRLRSK
jgi:hypothetical protein